MRAYVYKKTLKSGVAWSVRVVEQLPNGKKSEKWLGDPDTNKPFRTKKEAQNYLVQIQHSVLSGTYVSRSNLLFSEWLEHYLETVKVKLKPATYSSYEKNIRNHIVPNLGNTQIQKISTQQLNSLYARLLEGGKLTTSHGAGLGLSARTVAYIHTIIGASLREAVKQGVLVRNVATQATPPKAQRDPERVFHWNPNELNVFLKAIEGHPLEALYRFYAFTGCRRGEGLALTERSIDFDKGTVTLSATVNKIDGKVVTGSNKTARGHRTIKVDVELLKLLDLQLAQRVQDRRTLGSGYINNGLVFANVDGSHLYPERITRVFADIVKNLDVPKITLHGLRHTHASILLATGSSLNYVAQRLGDDSVTVMRTYAHVLPTEANVAVESFLATIANAGEEGNPVTVFQRRKVV